jgi:nitroreductase
MSLVDIVLSRRSIRSYTSQAIPSSAINKILEAGRQAPSAGNRQPWHFVVITDGETKKALSQGPYNWFIQNAPLTIIGCANTETSRWSTVDTAIALQNMVIAAWTMNIGSCWLGAFNEDEVKKLLQIPEKWKVVALLTLGYPSEGENRFPDNFQKIRHRLVSKKPIEEIISYDTFMMEAKSDP